MIAFSFRGTSFDYVRTMGPDRGSVEVFINGTLASTIVNGSSVDMLSNRGAITKGNQAQRYDILGAVSGQWNTVYIRPAVYDAADLNWFPGVIDVDRIRTYDYEGTSAV